MQETFNETLECTLTQDEALERGRELAHHQIEKNRLEDEKKEFDAQKKADIEKEETNIRRLTRVVNSGKEFRAVACVKNMNWAQDRREIIRTDTGEIVRHFPITPEERQEKLKFDEEQTAPSAEPATPPAAPEAQVADGQDAGGADAGQRDAGDAGKKKAGTDEKCENCSTVFIVQVPGQKYCSEKCKQAARNARKRENRAKRGKGGKK